MMGIRIPPALDKWCDLEGRFLPPGSVGAMRRLVYEASEKHGAVPRQTAGGVSNPRPVNGQEALDNSLQVKDTSPRRVGVSYNPQELVVFNETHPGKGIYHGHVRAWNELDQAMKKTLIDAGLTDRHGNILVGSR